MALNCAEDGGNCNLRADPFTLLKRYFGGAGSNPALSAAEADITALTTASAASSAAASAASSSTRVDAAAARSTVERLHKEGYARIRVRQDSAKQEYEPHLIELTTRRVVLAGSMRFTINGAQSEATVGQVIDFPAGTTASFSMGDGGCVYAVGVKRG